MTAIAPPVVVPPVAIPAWRALTDALHTATQPVPCTGLYGAWWTSANPEEREAAAYRCITCPAIRECHEYAATAKEPSGVWAGIDRETPRTNRRKKTAA